MARTLRLTTHHKPQYPEAGGSPDATSTPPAMLGRGGWAGWGIGESRKAVLLKT